MLGLVTSSQAIPTRLFSPPEMPRPYQVAFQHPRPSGSLRRRSCPLVISAKRSLRWSRGLSRWEAWCHPDRILLPLRL
ncbi:hypothetical protein KC325_g253 [Hortaea werneckii]|nr:hypothetical protein KC325_g253 [Hortaea werneckii]